MAERGALQLVQGKTKGELADRLVGGKKAEQSGATTSSVHLIRILQQEIDNIFVEALAEQNNMPTNNIVGAFLFKKFVIRYVAWTNFLL